MSSNTTEMINTKQVTTPYGTYTFRVGNFMYLREIKRGKVGYRQLFQSDADGRIFLAQTKSKDWYFVRYERSEKIEDGPYPTRREAEYHARRWFLDNPA